MGVEWFVKWDVGRLTTWFWAVKDMAVGGLCGLWQVMLKYLGRNWL